VSVLGTSSEAAPEYAEESVVLEEGLDLLEAYTVSGDEQLWLNVERTADIELGELESVAVYGVENGQVVQPLAEDLAAGETLSVSLEESEGFVLVKDTGLRRKALEAEDVVVEGMVPKEAALVVESVDTALELPDNSEAIASYNISIVNGEDAWQPDESVKVEMTCADAAQAVAEGYGVELWRVDADGSTEQVDFDLEGDTLVFDAQALPEYTVVRTVLEKTISTSDGLTYRITVEYDSNSGFPADAEIRASEVLDAAAYREYIESTVEALNVDLSSITYTKMLDIAIVDGEGNEYQPNDRVKVAVELLDEASVSVSDMRVVHFGDSAEELQATTDGATVTFSTDGFSLFSLCDFSLAEGVISADFAVITHIGNVLFFGSKGHLSHHGFQYL